MNTEDYISQKLQMKNQDVDHNVKWVKKRDNKKNTRVRSRHIGIPDHLLSSSGSDLNSSGDGQPRREISFSEESFAETGFRLREAKIGYNYMSNEAIEKRFKERQKQSLESRSSSNARSDTTAGSLTTLDPFEFS